MTAKRIIPFKATIDREVYPAIVYLRNRGINPTFSCSGHGKEKGYISFNGILPRTDKQVVQNTLRKRYGFSGIVWHDRRHRKYPRYTVKAASVVNFSVPSTSRTR